MTQFTPDTVATQDGEARGISGMQRSDPPTDASVAEAISRAVRRFGTRDCADRMVQEFGDHPQAAAERMCWVRQLTAKTTRPQASPILGPPGRSGSRPPAMARLTPRGGAEMNETGDRCGPAVPALYRVERHGELYLCGHCTYRLWAALSAQGWTIWTAGEHPLAPQANEWSGASWQRARRGRGSGGSPAILRRLFRRLRALALVCWSGDLVAWSSAANPRKQS
jgi:hypothetical protein